jgi:hypothetical protein
VNSFTEFFYLAKFQIVLALWMKQSNGWGVLARVSFPYLLERSRSEKRSMGVLNFKILNVSMEQW